MNCKYFQLARALHNYVDGTRLSGPADLHRQLLLLLGPKRCPSYSAVKMAMRGERDLPSWLILFMIERMSFKIQWEAALPRTDPEGNVVKSGREMTFPFMQESRRLRGGKR